MSRFRQATTIGCKSEGQSRRWLIACVAIAFVGLDLFVEACGRLWGDQSWYVYVNDLHGAIALAGVFLLGCVFVDSKHSLGLTLSPSQGWQVWLSFIFWALFALSVVWAVVASISLIAGPIFHSYTTPPSRLPSRLLVACFVAPIVEEATYRVVFCSGIVGVLGQFWTIVANGVVFALLHWLYGNPSPENQLAGFLLAWAYLRSGTIVLPIALHSVGNAFAVTTNVLAWAFDQ